MKEKNAEEGLIGGMCRTVRLEEKDQSGTENWLKMVSWTWRRSVLLTRVLRCSEHAEKGDGRMGWTLGAGCEVLTSENDGESDGQDIRDEVPVSFIGLALKRGTTVRAKIDGTRLESLH